MGQEEVEELHETVVEILQAAAFGMLRIHGPFGKCHQQELSYHPTTSFDCDTTLTDEALIHRTQKRRLR